MRLTTKGRCGSLHQFTQKVTNKHGETVEYPKVRGERNPDNPKHWKWQITWKEKIDGKWRTRCSFAKRPLWGIVPAAKVSWVKKAIAQSVVIERIQEFLS
jgi:hypothetical protein